MSGIAQAVGIKKASLYSHYPGKESIFKAVFDRILEDYRLFIGEISTCNDHSSSLAILRNIFSRYILNMMIIGFTLWFALRIVIYKHRFAV